MYSERFGCCKRTAPEEHLQSAKYLPWNLEDHQYSENRLSTKEQARQRKEEE